MSTFRLLMFLMIGMLSKSPSQNNFTYMNNIIRFDRTITSNEFIIFSISHFARHHPYPCGRPKANIIQILLILSGSIEVNPGPRRTNVKFPCGECNKAVRTVNAIACDRCNKWYHLNCLSMNTHVFNAYANDELLEWTCSNCALINLSNSVFDTEFSDSDSSINSEQDEEDNLPKVKKQSLRIMIINFQSIWGKKEQLTKRLYDHDIDVVIGSETHIDPSIKDSEIIPKGYTAFRNDRTNKECGGVIIIVRKNLSKN